MTTLRGIEGLPGLEPGRSMTFQLTPGLNPAKPDEPLLVGGAFEAIAADGSWIAIREGDDRHTLSVLPASTIVSLSWSTVGGVPADG